MSYYKLLLPVLFCLATNAVAMHNNKKGVKQLPPTRPSSKEEYTDLPKNNPPSPKAGQKPDTEKSPETPAATPSKERDLKSSTQLRREEEEYFAY